MAQVEAGLCLDEHFIGDEETTTMIMRLDGDTPVSEAASKQQPMDSDAEHSILDTEREVGVPFLAACAHRGLAVDGLPGAALGAGGAVAKLVAPLPGVNIDGFGRGWLETSTEIEAFAGARQSLGDRTRQVGRRGHAHCVCWRERFASFARLHVLLAERSGALRVVASVPPRGAGASRGPRKMIFLLSPFLRLDASSRPLSFTPNRWPRAMSRGGTGSCP